MTNTVNVQLHISFNSMTDSEVEVKLDKTYNTSVHISFQNPVKTPVMVGPPSSSLRSSKNYLICLAVRLR